MDFELSQKDDIWVASYSAMAGPCEIHMTCTLQSEAEELASLAVHETRRIEKKYSRYRDDNIVHAINSSQGNAVAIDDETSRLLHFADQCYIMSGGLFDISSGVLRKAWTFKGAEVDPDAKAIIKLLDRVGWQKARLTADSIKLKYGMEIDLGGIGKEYAVDRVAQILFGQNSLAVMVNFGGDIRVAAPDGEKRKWTIGIENPRQENSPVGHIEIVSGAVATSGDSRRYCMYQGKRLGHILNPRTGWPIEDLPRSVTVIGENCLEAGFLATLAMLRGAGAEEFLKEQGVTHYCAR